MFTSKLPADVKSKWLKALRSGDYEQGNGHLLDKHTSGMRYCCLGVLCEVLKVSKYVHDDNLMYGTSSDHSNDVLPHYIVKQLGISERGQYVDMEANSLTRINDSGKTFNEIADIIEKEL